MSESDAGNASSVYPVLVTGGTGFLGGHMARALLARNLSVRVTGRNLEAGARLSQQGADFRPVDLTDRRAMIACCRNVSTVIHSGAYVSPWGRERDYYDTNVLGTENVIAGCLAHGVRRLIYISTPSVMTREQDQVGLTEADPLPAHFISSYARTKKIGEDRVSVAQSANLETVIVRPKAIYGPGDNAILPRFIQAASRNRLVRIAGHDPITNLTHVSDVVQAIFCAMERDAAVGQTYFITGGEDRALWQVIDSLLAGLGYPPPRRQLSMGKARVLADAMTLAWRNLKLPGEPPLTRFTVSILAYSQTYDISKARRELGYSPRVSIDEGLEQMIALYKNEQPASRARTATAERSIREPSGSRSPRVTVEATLLNGGSCRVKEALFMAGGGLKPITVPALFALIRHPHKGCILFDTGYSPRFYAATEKLPFRLYRFATPVKVSEKDTAVAQLRARSFSPEEVRYIIVSHFDPDHIGGLRDFPSARIVCSARAWEAVRDKQGFAAFRLRFMPDLLPDDIAARLMLLADPDGPSRGPFPASHDLFGDGSVILVSLPGHAPGQLGAFVQLAGDKMWFLAADACWQRSALSRGSNGPHSLHLHDRAEQATTHSRLRRLRNEHPDVTIIPAHCPEAAVELVDTARQPRSAPTTTYPQAVKIVGIGHYVPRRVVPSSELEGRFDPDRPAGWIEEIQGVRERRWVTDETNSFMGAQAARNALGDAGIEPQDIDLIINASGTTEQAIPDGAPLLQRQLGLSDSGVACITVHTTCLSFISALDLAGHLLSTGRYNSICIVSSEITSCALNFNHIESSTLFGDGAAAVIVQRTPDNEASCIHAARFETYGEGAYFTQVAGGGTRKHPDKKDTKPEDNLFYMDGKQVFRMALQHGVGFVKRLKSDLDTGFEDIKAVIPHQSSKRALNAHPRVLGVKRDRILRTIDHFGNCVAASIPLTLFEAVKQERIVRGDKILLFGTGAGLSFGGIVLTY